MVQQDELKRLHEQVQRDEEIAERIFTGVVTARNIELESLRTLLRPAATFSGDILLMARPPAGGIHILLGDFTGHGLSAAIGALPVSEVFFAMTGKGFDAAGILAEINRKLNMLLPTGMFMAGTLISVDRGLRFARVWNAGMPEALVISSTTGRIERRLASQLVPLGIQKDIDVSSVDSFDLLAVSEGDHILLYSDGVIEARNEAGEMFGSERLEACAGDKNGHSAAKNCIAEALDRFCLGAAQEDDITLVNIACVPELVLVLPVEDKSNGARDDETSSAVEDSLVRSADRWLWATELNGPRLRSIDPIPQAMSQLKEMLDLESPSGALYTILAELYNNALDHGVLELDSSLKASEVGFAYYSGEREQRLANLREGSVRLELEVIVEGGNSYLMIRFEDSGPGFDYRALLASLGEVVDSGEGLYNCGIALVSELCESLEYSGTGNRVEAVYRCGTRVD